MYLLYICLFFIIKRKTNSYIFKKKQCKKNPKHHQKKPKEEADEPIQYLNFVPVTVTAVTSVTVSVQIKYSLRQQVKPLQLMSN